MRASGAASAVLMVSVLGAPAAAEPPLLAPVPEAPLDEAPPALVPPEAAPGFPARYPRFRAEEIGATVALFAGLTLTTYLVPTPPEGFKGEWVIDDAIRDAVRATSRDQQNRLSTVSDALQNVALVVPLVVDLGLGALLLKGDFDLALQMALIDAEVLALSTALVMVTKRTIGRVRPNLPECADGTYGCHSNASRRAFISGHSNAVFAAAGLSCVHHHYLQLFGGIGDDLMCAGMLSVATSASLLRVAADKHWATDVVAGALTGLFSGYAVPYLLHYQGEADWPGMRDGELDGSLAMSLVGGVNAVDGRTSATAGVELTGRALWHVRRPLRLELSMQGRLLYDSEAFGVRDVLGEARTWLGPVALGAAAQYRAQDGAKDAVVGWTGGATLSFGTFDERRPWLLSLRWLPLGGRVEQVAARLEWAPWRHLTVHGEVSPYFAETEDGRRLAAAAIFGAGGRLPW